jgi:hypothetical protein
MAGHLGLMAGLGFGKGGEGRSRLESPLYLGGDCLLPIASCLMILMILMSKSLAAGLIVGGWGGVEKIAPSIYRGGCSRNGSPNGERSRSERPW